MSQPTTVATMAGTQLSAESPTQPSTLPSALPSTLPSTTLALQPRANLREQVTAALRAALISGQMTANTVYSVPALAEQFGVSATPVREAMLDLARQGLVEAVPNKGFRVTELSDRDLDEITELRVLIEVPTVVGLAGRIPAGAAKELMSQADAIVEAAQQQDLAAYLEADRRFHLDLLALGGNQRLVEAVDGLRARSRLSALHTLAESGALVASAREHSDIIGHLVAGDTAGAEAMMRQHLRHVRGEWAGRP